MAEAGIGSREGKGPALREGPAERHSMSLQMGYPPGTEFPQKCSRCLSLPSTCHGFPAKVFQVSFSAVHLPRFSCESAKVFQVASPCFPPGTVFPQKCSRWLFLSSTWHGNSAKAFQVAPLAVHLPQKHCPVLKNVYQAVGNTDDL